MFTTAKFFNRNEHGRIKSKELSRFTSWMHEEDSNCRKIELQGTNIIFSYIFRRNLKWVLKNIFRIIKYIQRIKPFEDTKQRLQREHTPISQEKPKKPTNQKLSVVPRFFWIWRILRGSWCWAYERKHTDRQIIQLWGIDLDDYNWFREALKNYWNDLEVSADRTKRTAK